MQEADGALGTLVLVDVRHAHAVAAAAGREVVQRQAEAVGAEEPRERLAHAAQVVRVFGHRVRAAEREHERRRIDGLLVGYAPSRPPALCHPVLPTSCK